jgi:hypothetical protein
LNPFENNQLHFEEGILKTNFEVILIL